MSLHIFLDTGPLGIATNPREPPLTRELLQWAARHLREGNTFLVPAMADYEVRRELTRLKRTASIRELDRWNGTPANRYLTLTDSALKRAADLWAQVRNQGLVTADPKELDCDVLIAAQALEYQEIHRLSPREVVVATTNVGHLSRFVRAELWSEI